VSGDSSGAQGAADPFERTASGTSPPALVSPRSVPRTESRRRLARASVRWLTGSAAAVPLLGLLGMVAVLVVEALPAIRYNGAGFFTRSTWEIGSLYGGVVRSGGATHLAGASFGAWPLILGTLESAGLALVIGLPIAVGSAALVVERLPGWLAAGVGVCLEVLAGIPSVVFGLWGVLVLGPFLVAHIYPTLAKLPDVPPLSIFHGTVGHGEGMLTAGIVLAVMIIPIIAATTRDLLRQVPTTTKEGAEALGMTNREVFRAVQVRWIRTGVIGAAVLGLGRALGETIAIAMVSGAIFGTAHNIYGQFSTIAAQIVTELDAALIDPSRMAVRSLAEAALVLLAITLIVNVAARLLVRRVAAGSALPVGAGF
jgi:phosphate transport system permease protein